MTGGAPPGTREQALAQLEAARRDLIEQRVRYLALASAEVDEHWAVCLFGISVAGFSPPAQFRPSPTLARVLQHQYSEGQAVVEEFATGHGLAVGVQRCDVLAVPGAEPPQHLDTGVAEAMVLFPDLEVVGVVNGYCLDLDDLDRTTAIVGAIAHTLNITAPSSASLSAR